MLAIRYKKAALKFLKKQTRETQMRIISAINNIPNGDIKNLKGTQFKRLRVGTYRIIFDEHGTIITIVNIGNRGCPKSLEFHVEKRNMQRRVVRTSKYLHHFVI